MQQLQQQQQQGPKFPMPSDEFLRKYGRHLSAYERDEVASFETIYYFNFAAKLKGTGQFVRGELTCQDENPQPTEATAGVVFNHGFDNDQADYLYEAKDHINYRYEVHKKLGKGAFGVVVRCFDHKN
jgi:dual specificity tyrosine-phosphorylation-regulated kinase 2/3/4